MCRKYAVPKNPRSAEQLTQREKFSDAVIAWQALIGVHQDLWRANATGMVMTGYNLFIRDYLLRGGPSTTPLLITEVDYLHINITRSTLPTGWLFDFLGTTGYLSLGYIRDNQNITLANTRVFSPAQKLVIKILRVDLPVATQRGDHIELQHGGNYINVYLPDFPGLHPPTFVYVADDGSTYYDEALTNLAYGAP